MSKRSRQRCKAPAIKAKAVCRSHAGLSTGPRTEAGKLRVRTANLKHGRETFETRAERSLALARLAILEAVGFSIGLLKGTKTRGRRPDQMAGAYSELQSLLKQRINVL